MDEGPRRANSNSPNVKAPQCVCKCCRSHPKMKPMRWTLRTGNIVDEPADVLVCSANPHLTLSGGVGAELLARYGSTMQTALERIVRQRTPHFLDRGEVIPYSDATLPYRAILHAVAVDGWYESTPQVIQQIV